MSKILILEDSSETASLYQYILKEYDLDIAYNVSQAVKLIESVNYDLFILDVFIDHSRLTGLDFAKLVDNKNVIICTSLDISYLKQTNYKNYTYVQKPIEVKQLKKLVKNMLDEDF